MIRRIFTLFCMLALAGIATAQSTSDPNEGFRVSRNGYGGILTFSWWGRSGRNYFIQQSDDLASWNYLPIMDSGANQILQWSLTSSMSRGFLRLQFDDDQNGLPDAWELANYGPNYRQLHLDPNGLAPRGDGLTNIQTLFQGLNPFDVYNGTQPAAGQNTPVVSLTSTASGTLTAPAAVTLTATASETNGTIARVDFYEDGSYIGSAYNAPFTYQLSNLTPADYQLKAVAVDAVGFSTASNTINVAVAPPVTTVASTRYSRGTGTDSSYQSYVVAMGFEKGTALDQAQFTGGLPWFMRIQQTVAYQISATQNPPIYSVPIANPLVAFGTQAGGTPLYTGQNYSFGIGSGGLYVGDTQANDLLISVYRKADFSTTQTPIAPTSYGGSPIPLPRPGTSAWETFAQNGYVQTQSVNDSSGNPLFKIMIQYVSGGSSSDQWGESFLDQWGQLFTGPILVTVTSYTADYYLQVSLKGRTVINSQLYWMAIDNNPPTYSSDYSLSFTMDFEARPPWRATYIDQPHFQGIPLPSAYQGKTLEELLHNAQPVTDTLTAPANGTLLTLDASPELRQHPILDKFVSDMGSDPLALVNYVLNEIELTDAISYNDTGNVSDQSINAGGVNRGALATFLEGQGSPAEQCGLLVYLLRKAGYQCQYVIPQQRDSLLMLDQQLSKLLRMQLKGAEDPSGNSNVPHLIPVNYPWVAAYIGGKWVHIFPWLKDTAVEEGQDLYQYLPTGYQSGKQWLNHYLLDDPTIRSLSAEYDNPGYLFPAFVKQSLASNFPGISIDQLGVNFYNRKNYFTSWSDLPRPWQSPTVANGDVKESLSLVPNIFDTLKVTIYKVNGSTQTAIMQTDDLRMVDLHNRRFLLYAVQNTPNVNAHTLKLSLEEFRPSTQGNTPGNFAASDSLLNKQLLTASLGSGDDALLFAIDYKRHRSLPTGFTPPGHWASFLGVDDSMELTDTRPLRKGDMAAFVMNYGRVTSAMLNTHAQQYQNAQQQTTSSGAPVDQEIAQGIPAFMLGMSYYYNVSQTKQQILNLTKTNIVSFFGHGFAKLGPQRNNDATGTLINNGQISLIYPKVDMAFNRMAWANNGTLHPDSGNEENPPTNDWVTILIGEVSAQEHRTINKFFQKSAAVSTVKLLDITQGNTPASGVVRIDKSNYDSSQAASPWNTLYTATVNNQSVQKKLMDWAGGAADPQSLYSHINGGFSHWDANFQQVLITPGPVTVQNANNQIYYQGIGAFVTGVDFYAAYITDNMNVQNGGWGVPNLQPIDTTPTLFTSWVLQPTPDYSYSLVNNLNQSGSTSLFYTPTSISLANAATGYDQINIGSLTFSDPITTNALNLSATFLYPAGNAPTVSTTNFTANANLWQTVQNIGSVTETSDNRGLFGSLDGLAKAVMDPVNVVTGEFYVDALDVRLNGPMPLDIRRNYGSQNLSDGNFGYGWKLAYVPYLVVSTDSSVIYATEIDGSVVAYRQQSSPNTRWVPTTADNPQLTNLAGDAAGSLTNVFNNRIDKTTSGADTFYTLTGVDGSVRTFKVQSFPIPNSPGKTDGLTRLRPYLQTWKDNRGNTYTFTFGSDSTAVDWGQLVRVASTNGSFVGFNYDAYGHIIEAFTGDGRRLSYKYDSYGDLVQATLPDGSTIGYQYEHLSQTVSGTMSYYSDHLIIQETKPQGRVLVNTYDSATSRRVTQQQATVGQNFALVTNAQFGYFTANGTTRPAGAPNTPIIGYTVITDVNQHPTKYEYANGLITKVTDQLTQTVVQTWFQQGDGLPGSYQRSLKSRTDKRGLLTEYQYDNLGNLVQKKLTGDLTGNGQTDVALTSSAYNALNMVTQTTDPAGNSAIYTYADSTHPYLPTAIEKRTPGGSVSTMTFQYQDVSGNGNSAWGVLQQETKAVGTTDQAVTNFTNNANGFVTQTSRPTGTFDPAVVVNFAYNLRGELTSETDALNRMTKYAYDGRGHRIWTEWHDETGALISWWYDYYNQNGEIEWSDGPRYNPEDYVLRQYDGAGRLSQVVKWRSQASADGSGVQAVPGLDDAYASTFYVHDTFGNLTEIRDPRRNSTTMQYDALGQLLGRQRRNGNANATVVSSESFLYETGGEVSQYTNPLGGVTTKVYTSTGKLKQQSDLVTGTVLQWRYDLLGRVVKETLSNGSYWGTAYDDLNRTVTRTFYSSGGASLASETTTYDRRGNVVSKRDTENNTFTSTYDALDRVTSKTGPAASGSTAQETISHTYGTAGKVHIVMDALGQKTHTVSDALGRPILVLVKDKKNFVVRQTSYVYEPDHNSVTQIDGIGSTAVLTTTLTNTLGRPVLVKHGDGNFQLYSYDSGENQIYSQDENGFGTNNTYDALNRLWTQTLPGGAATTFVYDAAGNVLQRQMPGGLTWNATYDNASRKLTEQLNGINNAITRNFTYSYYQSGSNVGLLQTTGDPRGVNFTTTYDDFLRPLTVTASGSQAKQNQTTTYGYDTLSRLKSIAQSYTSPSTGSSTLVQRSYDGYGHISTETVSIDGTVQNQWNQGWDGAGNRSSLASTLAPQGSGAGLSTSYTYWADGLPRQTTAAGGSYVFNYDKNALLSSRSNGWRTQTISSRDPLGRVLAEQDTVSGGTPLSETQTWYQRSQRSSYTANWSGTGVWNETRNYSYNGRGQLYQESDAPSAGAYADYLYRFDFDLGVSGSGLGVRTIAMRRSSANDYGTWQPGSWVTDDPALFNWVSQRGSDAFQRPTSDEQALTTNLFYPNSRTYDAIGQITWRSTWTSDATQNPQQTLTWDSFGRLVTVGQRDGSNNGFDWSAVYDGLGRRLRTVQQNVVGGAASGTPLTLDSYYDPQVEFLELGVAANGTRTWKVYGPDLNGRYGGLQGIGGLEAMIDETSGTVTPVVNDVFGNVVGTISGGAMTWNTVRVGSYGVLPGSSAPVLDGTSVSLAQATLWRGHRIDPAGLYYLGARYYEPNSGRFLSADPLGHGSSMSLYDYASGDPVNGVDPDGRFGKGIVSGWNGNIAADAPNSAAFNFGMMFGGTTRGATDGLGIGVQNVSGYTSYTEHLAVFEGDTWAAGNAAWNPAYMAMRGFTEAGTGSGLQPGNLGQTLSTGQRVWSGVEGGLGTVSTAGAGFGGVGLTRSLGLTAPSLETAIQAPSLVKVTSWASEGITPDLNPGRWVQLGEATPVNFLKTGLPGPKGFLQSSPPFLKIEGSTVPFSNFITGEVPANSLQRPGGFDKWRGLFGQRQIIP
jgi:RHS repeat-associated protein